MVPVRCLAKCKGLHYPFGRWWYFQLLSILQRCKCLSNSTKAKYMWWKIWLLWQVSVSHPCKYFQSNLILSWDPTRIDVDGNLWWWWKERWWFANSWLHRQRQTSEDARLGCWSTIAQSLADWQLDLWIEFPTKLFNSSLLQGLSNVKHSIFER